MKKTRHTRPSRRYSGYIRVPAKEFKQALVTMIKTDAADLIEMGNFNHTLSDLEERVNEHECYSVSSRLTRRICKQAGVSSPMKLTGDEFNTTAEIFYRDQLKREHIGHALDLWCEEVLKLDGLPAWRAGRYNQALMSILKGMDAVTFISRARFGLIAEDLPLSIIIRLIHLMLLTLDHMKQQSSN